MAGLTQAVTHLQRTRRVRHHKRVGLGSPSCEFSEQNARPAETKLEARARLGRGCSPSAARRTPPRRRAARWKRWLFPGFRDGILRDGTLRERDVSASLRAKENRNAKEIETRLALLLCAADAERTVGERFASRARGLRLRARARGGGGVGGGRPGILRGGTLREGLRTIRAIRRRGVRGEGAARARRGGRSRRGEEGAETRRRRRRSDSLRQKRGWSKRNDSASAHSPSDPSRRVRREPRSPRRRDAPPVAVPPRGGTGGAAACVTEMLALAEANGVLFRARATLPRGRRRVRCARRRRSSSCAPRRLATPRRARRRRRRSETRSRGNTPPRACARPARTRSSPRASATSRAPRRCRDARRGARRERLRRGDGGKRGPRRPRSRAGERAVRDERGARGRRASSSRERRGRR